MRNSNTNHKGQRVAFLVDVQHLYHSLKKKNSSKVDYGNLLEEVVGNRQLVRAVAYVVSKEGVNQGKFIGALRGFGFDIRERKIHSTGEHYRSVNWDVAITVDALQLADKVDTICIASGSGALTDTVHALQNKGCRVEVYSLYDSTSNYLVRASDSFFDIPTEATFDMEDEEYDEEDSPEEDYDDSEEDDVEYDDEDVE